MCVCVCDLFVLCLHHVCKCIWVDCFNIPSFNICVCVWMLKCVCYVCYGVSDPSGLHVVYLWWVIYVCVFGYAMHTCAWICVIYLFLHCHLGYLCFSRYVYVHICEICVSPLCLRISLFVCELM